MSQYMKITYTGAWHPARSQEVLKAVVVLFIGMCLEISVK